jgi:hypothetical protein
VHLVLQFTRFLVPSESNILGGGALSRSCIASLNELRSFQMQFRQCRFLVVPGTLIYLFLNLNALQSMSVQLAHQHSSTNLWILPSIRKPTFVLFRYHHTELSFFSKLHQFWHRVITDRCYSLVHSVMLNVSQCCHCCSCIRYQLCASEGSRFIFFISAIFFSAANIILR